MRDENSWKKVNKNVAFSCIRSSPLGIRKVVFDWINALRTVNVPREIIIRRKGKCRKYSPRDSVGFFSTRASEYRSVSNRETRVSNETTRKNRTNGNVRLMSSLLIGHPPSFDRNTRAIPPNLLRASRTAWTARNSRVARDIVTLDVVTRWSRRYSNAFSVRRKPLSEWSGLYIPFSE